MPKQTKVKNNTPISVFNRKPLIQIPSGDTVPYNFYHAKQPEFKRQK